ncbi:MAG: restriction endonuclease subunit S [Myxococcales bacterium]|nr:restriction endonuclease subunit S [Myxococcales bacterium]
MNLRIPQGWQAVPLGELAIEGPTNGYSPQSDPNGQGSLSLKLSATTQQRLILNEETIKRLREEIAPDASVWLRPGDLLVQRSNTAELVGTAAIFDGPPNTYIYPDLMMRLRFGDEATTRWVWRYMNSAAGRRFFRVMAAGAAGSMPKISGAKLRTMLIPVPPLPEQRRIADILDKADAIRRKRKEAITLTEDLLRSAFLEMFGDPLTNPKGWQVEPLAKLGRITTGNTPSRAVDEYFGDNIEWIKSDNINTPSHYLTRATEGLSAQGRTVGRTAPARSTLMTCIAGSPDCIGNVALADREVAFNQQINAVTPHDGVDHRFLYVLLLVGKHLVQAASTNSMKGMVSKGKLAEVRVPVPPLRAQRRFGETFDRVLRIGQRQESAFHDAELLFAATVQRAFSGQLMRAGDPC